MASLPIRPNPLTRYQAKRNFAITPEPLAGGETVEHALSFVIQKHWASRLHYDFRLELGGTMKSWAIPKGPSFDPRDKRMAVHVEDHPISYSDFEGIIPDKQYGAGKVLIWDKGTWHPLGDARRDYANGHLKFELRGHKLHGKWALIRMKSKSQKDDPWLLIKEKDALARSSAQFSVVDEMPDRVTGATPVTTVTATTALADTDLALPPEAILALLPAQLAPQLATLAVGSATDAKNWVIEIKFDGYRLLTRIDAGDIRLFTRNGNDWTGKLMPLRKAIAKMALPSGWYDGELVVPDEKGVPDFGALQQSFDSEKTDAIVLYLFDLPYFNGYDLRAAPLHVRRAMLQCVLKKRTSEAVRFSDAFDGSLDAVLASACKLGLEGVIAKRRNSPYLSQRSTDWIKLKCGQRQEFVVGGYTDPLGTRTGIGALLLGVYDDHGALQYAGKVGTGFSQSALTNVKIKLDALTASNSPFAPSAAVAGEPHWVKPTLVAEVAFAGWTRAGHIRHSVFHGLRTDKDARLIQREKAANMKAISTPATTAVPASLTLATRIQVSHSERVIDASTGITKIELVRYYDLVGDLMMHHLKGRPVSLLRAPAGVSGELFFQKHAGIEALPGIRQLDPALDPGHAAMLEVASRQGLLSAAQWNVVELHTVNALAKSFDHPDRMMFDLDPGDGVPWVQVQEAAELVRAFLTQLGLPSFLKTSGGKGLHVVVPLRRVHDWDTVKAFSGAIVAHLAQTIPQRFVAKSGPKNRVGKIFVDYLRNTRGATTVCAWSARARPGLGISVPVEWSELKALRASNHWCVRTAHTRLDKGNEPWAGYSRAACSLSAAMKMLS